MHDFKLAASISQEAGGVVNIRLVSDFETGRPKGFAFVEYEDAATALSAIRNLNGYECNNRPVGRTNRSSTVCSGLCLLVERGRSFVGPEIPGSVSHFQVSNDASQHTFWCLLHDCLTEAILDARHAYTLLYLLCVNTASSKLFKQQLPGGRTTTRGKSAPAGELHVFIKCSFAPFRDAIPRFAFCRPPTEDAAPLTQGATPPCTSQNITQKPTSSHTRMFTEVFERLVLVRSLPTASPLYDVPPWQIYNTLRCSLQSCLSV